MRGAWWVVEVVICKFRVECLTVFRVADDHFAVVVAICEVVRIALKDHWQVEAFSLVVDVEQLCIWVGVLPETTSLCLGHSRQSGGQVSWDDWKRIPNISKVVYFSHIHQKRLIIIQTSLKCVVKVTNKLRHIIEILWALTATQRALFDAVHDLACEIEVSEKRHQQKLVLDKIDRQ